MRGYGSGQQAAGNRQQQRAAATGSDNGQRQRAAGSSILVFSCVCAGGLAQSQRLSPAGGCVDANGLRRLRSRRRAYGTGGEVQLQVGDKGLIQRSQQDAGLSRQCGSAGSSARRCPLLA